jgi:NlpC/P60 family putative phage cell wall peptidase
MTADAARIIMEARQWLGTPYRHQASLKGVGCDCLGLVRGVWRALYGEEPEVPEPYQKGWAEPPGEERLYDAARRHMNGLSLDEWRAGDVLLFRWRAHWPAKHIAIATGADAIIHAYEGASVTESAIGPWRQKIAYAFRFPALPNEGPSL